MNITEVTTKIFNFCQKTYPELKWSFTSLSRTQDMIYGYRPKSIWIDIKFTNDFRNYIEGRSTISNLDWEGSFLVWINDRKNSKISFKKSGTAKHEELNLWRKKGTQIMIDIFQFIKNEIQTEVTL